MNMLIILCSIKLCYVFFPYYDWAKLKKKTTFANFLSTKSQNTVKIQFKRQIAFKKSSKSKRS